MIVVPAVLLAVLLVVQFALGFHARQVLAGATQDGAAAAARVDATPAEGEALARQLVEAAAGSLLDDADVSAVSGSGTVTVTATGSVVSVLPFLGSITVRASATAKVETFDPQGAAP